MASAPSRTLLAPPFTFWEAARALPNSEASCWRSCALGPGWPAPFKTYWGALSSEGIYLKDELNLLAEAYPRFSWVGCAEAAASEDSDLRMAGSAMLCSAILLRPALA